jgi:hypothetical protein
MVRTTHCASVGLPFSLAFDDDWTFCNELWSRIADDAVLPASYGLRVACSAADASMGAAYADGVCPASTANGLWTANAAADDAATDGNGLRPTTYTTAIVDAASSLWTAPGLRSTPGFRSTPVPSATALRYAPSGLTSRIWLQMSHIDQLFFFK